MYVCMRPPHRENVPSRCFWRLAGEGIIGGAPAAFNAHGGPYILGGDADHYLMHLYSHQPFQDVYEGIGKALHLHAHSL